MSETPAEYNATIIGEFRTHQGRLAGMWENVPLLLLHHIGAKSGARRVNPLGYLADEQRYLIFASNGGAPNHPAWYYNLKTRPTTRIEVGSRMIDVVAEEARGDDRERLFARGVERFPQLAEFARKTRRLIPVIVLTPRGSSSAPSGLGPSAAIPSQPTTQFGFRNVPPKGPEACPQRASIPWPRRSSRLSQHSSSR